MKQLTNAVRFKKAEEIIAFWKYLLLYVLGILAGTRLRHFIAVIAIIQAGINNFFRIILAMTHHLPAGLTDLIVRHNVQFETGLRYALINDFLRNLRFYAFAGSHSYQRRSN